MGYEYIDSNTYMAYSLYRSSYSIGIAIDYRPNSSNCSLYKEEDEMNIALSFICIVLLVMFCCWLDPNNDSW